MVKNSILTVLLLTFCISEIFATAQAPDKLIYKGDTIFLFSNPLEQFVDIEALRPRMFEGKAGCMTTGCWRRYQAEWTMIDNQLFLTAIYSCCYNEDKIKADLKSLFGEKCENGRVKADWVTGNLISPQGELLYYIHNDYESAYEKEVVFEIVNGQLKGTMTYDNSMSKRSEYSKDQEKLFRHIYGTINWDKLPEYEPPVRVALRFSANKQGVIDSVMVLRESDDVFDVEAIRVVKTIPDWDVYCRQGQLVRKWWTFPVVFSEENKQKYYQK